MSCEYIVSTIESRYDFELAFSDRGLTAGCRVKSGEKYWKYSVSTGRSVSSSWVVIQSCREISMKYMVTLVVKYLGWVDLDLGCSIILLGQ